jgi:hypothetical protein
VQGLVLWPTLIHTYISYYYVQIKEDKTDMMCSRHGGNNNSVYYFVGNIEGYKPSEDADIYVDGTIILQ